MRLLLCVNKDEKKLALLRIGLSAFDRYSDQISGGDVDSENRPRGYKTIFMLNSVKHEILNSHKYKNIKKFGLFLGQISIERYFSRPKC